MDNERENTEETPSETPSPSALANLTGRLGPISKLAVKHWVAIVVIGSVGIHGAIHFSSTKEAAASKAEAPDEFSLGTFHFASDPEDTSSIRKAEFDLHLSLLEDVHNVAEARLTTRRFMVQQNIEQLLRRAHGSDFGDPDLAEIKRQLQETINDTLSMRGISEVIVTDLDIRHEEKQIAAQTAKSAKAAPDMTAHTTPGSDQPAAPSDPNG